MDGWDDWYVLPADLPLPSGCRGRRFEEVGAALSAGLAHPRPVRINVVYGHGTFDGDVVILEGEGIAIT